MEMDFESMVEVVRNIYEQLPFNRLIGMKIDKMSLDESIVSFQMKDELVGNYYFGILHGGVISSVLDLAGGCTAVVSALERVKNKSMQAIGERVSRISTIDLRVDYLRPGKGESFLAKSTAMRSGNKVAVARMELYNQENLLIATGTGAYSIG